MGNGSLAARLERVARAAARRPVPVLAVGLVLALAGGLLALGLETRTGTETLVGKDTPTGRASQDYREAFGDDAIVVLVRQRLVETVDTSDLGRLISLEGCLSGNVPRGRKPYGARGGPCWRLAERRPVQVVYGPGTFLNEAVNQVSARLRERITAAQRRSQQVEAAARRRARQLGRSPAEQERLAREAGRAARLQFVTELARLSAQTGIQGVPRIDDPGFINQIVFDPTRGAEVPKARFGSLFPSSDTALVQVRLKPGLDDAERRAAIALVRDAVALPGFRLQNGGSYVVTGFPVLADALGREIQGALGLLLLAAVLVMALTLLVVFRARLRLLPLAVALAAAGLTFGALALAGAGLTLASVAVLPVLIGLAVDYAVQFQSRAAEEEAAGHGPGEAVARAAARGGPTVAAAGLATVTGFAVLVLSPVPMVRGFGVLLVVGVVLALGCTLVGVSAALAWRPSVPRPLARAGRGSAASLAGARELLSDAPGVRGGGALVRSAGARLAAGFRGAAASVARRPRAALAAGLALAVVGWAAGAATEVESDVTELVPQDMPALADLRTLQDETGVSGEIDVLVSADDVTRPEVITWMARYQREVLDRFGYSARRGCGDAPLCPTLSLPDLFGLGGPGAPRVDAEQVRRVVAAVPPYFSRAVITPDRRRASLTFGLKLLPLDEQRDVVEELGRRLDPPAGARARLAGLPVLATEAHDRLASPWRRAGVLLASLLAVAVALLAVFRRPGRALLPLVPIVLATGWSALLLWVLRTPLNPMSAMLGVLVVAIATEFSVLLSERYRQEREGGRAPADALARTYASTGRAVGVSAVTALAGFAVLVVSDVAMIRQFGLATVLDLGVTVLGVLLVLPAVLALAERERPFARRASRPPWARRRATA